MALSYRQFMKTELKRVKSLHPSKKQSLIMKMAAANWQAYKKKHGLVTKAGAKRKSPRKSPKKKSPRRKTPKRRTPKRKTPKRKTPKRKTPKRKTPKRKTPKRKTPKRKSVAKSRGTPTHFYAPRYVSKAQKDDLRRNLTSLMTPKGGIKKGHERKFKELFARILVTHGLSH